MARVRNAFFGLMTLATLLSGCVTVACDPDDPQFGKDCYECTRRATLEVRKVDPGTERRINTKERIKEETEDCLRARGYLKQKREGRL